CNPKSWAAIWRCMTQHRISSWISSRTPFPRRELDMRKHFIFLHLLFSQLIGCQSEGGPSPQEAVAAPVSQASAQPQGNVLDVRLPLEQQSVRFAVIGDSGTGDRPQYEVAQQMELYRQKVGFDFVLMLGDNIYGGHRPKDFLNKFERPYKPLLDAGVKFYAVLGNHDDPNDERLYKPFNMNGE